MTSQTIQKINSVCKTLFLPIDFSEMIFSSYFLVWHYTENCYKNVTTSLYNHRLKLLKLLSLDESGLSRDYVKKNGMWWLNILERK